MIEAVHETARAGAAPEASASLGAGTITTEEVWHELSARLRRFVASRVRNRDDADDVLQEVFLKVHDRLPTLEDSSRLLPWVFRIAKNAIADHFRRRGRAPELVAELPDDLAAEDAEPDLTDEVAAWLVPVVESLPKAYRDALMLSEIEGLTQRETAERLAISLSGAKSRVQRGREMLRKALLDCCHVELGRSGRVVEWKSRRDCACAGDDRRNFLASIRPAGRLSQ